MYVALFMFELTLLGCFLEGDGHWVPWAASGLLPLVNELSKPLSNLIPWPSSEKHEHTRDSLPFFFLHLPALCLIHEQGPGSGGTYL